MLKEYKFTLFVILTDNVVDFHVKTGKNIELSALIKMMNFVCLKAEGFR